MKKIFFVVLTLVSVISAEVNFHDEATVDNIGIAGTYPNFRLLDSQAAGIWFLRGKFPAKWKRIKNDEFELNDAIQEAYNALKNIAKSKYNEFINKNASMILSVQFGKYDFKTKSFPLEMMTKNSYVRYNGKNLIRALHLYFDNTGEKERKLSIVPEQAKTFLQKRKGSYGYVDRKIYAKYYFTIKKLDTDVDTINSNVIDNWMIEAPNVKMIGHIYKIEIIDPKTNRVLAIFNKN